MKMAAKRIPVIGTNIAGSQAAAYTPVMSFRLVFPRLVKLAKRITQMFDTDQSGLAVNRPFSAAIKSAVAAGPPDGAKRPVEQAMVLDRPEANGKRVYS